MSYATLRYEVAGTGVATIALDQPESRNALSDELLDDLIAALEAARDDVGVRCVVLTSTHERIFSAGANLGGFAGDTTLVEKMRAEIIALGGEVRFESKVTDVLIEDGRVEGVVLDRRRGTAQPTMWCWRSGHSSRDTLRDARTARRVPRSRSRSRSASASSIRSR